MDKSLSRHILPGKRLHIFDLGNVLYKVDARLTMDAFEKLGMPRLNGPVSNSHAAGGVFSLYSDGKVTTADFIAGVRKACRIPDADDGQIVKAWNSMLLGFCRESILAVRKVRKQGALVALLSNCNELHAMACRSEFRELYPDLGSFDQLFDHVFFSQEIGMSKPDPGTWQMVLADMGVSPADAAFYDDSEINVAEARRQGVESVLFCL